MSIPLFKPRFRRLWAPAAVLATGLGGVFSHAHAGDPVTDALVQAYAPYRAALFRTNSKAQSESEQALAQARQAWGALSQRYRDQRPFPYERDGEFARTLAQVDLVYAQAQQEVAAKDLGKAHETLEKVRDLLSELRRRNSVVLFSDHMNAYHERMELVLEQTDRWVGTPAGQQALIGHAAVLEYLAERLESEALPGLNQQPEFKQLLGAVRASVKALGRATESQDPQVLREAIGQLKKPYSQLFLKFG